MHRNSPGSLWRQAGRGEDSCPIPAEWLVVVDSCGYGAGSILLGMKGYLQGDVNEGIFDI